jgi:hypothetical protein
MTLDVSRQNGEECLATSSLEVDFALVLASAIDSIRDDPAQLRNTVYQLARIKLEEEAFLREPSVGTQEIRRLNTALETAIRGVEIFALKKESRTPLSLPDINECNRLIGSRDPILTIDHPPIGTSKTQNLAAFLTSAKHVKLRSHIERLLVFVAVSMAVLYATLERHFGSVASPKLQETASTIQAASADPQLVDTRSLRSRIEQSVVGEQRFVADPQQVRLPLPNVYGVFAISDGQLHELDMLPGRVPDQRVLVSAAIKKPSHTILADGRVVFVAYRRDLMTSAPDRVSVRAVAKIMRSMTFDANGKADTARLEDVWTIRSISYQFRVAPVGENSEMFVFRPEIPDFVFPAGRYALVLNGQGYDFTVAGTITEAAQCLERTEAANGTFYSECNRRTAK